MHCQIPFLLKLLVHYLRVAMAFVSTFAFCLSSAFCVAQVGALRELQGDEALSIDADLKGPWLFRGPFVSAFHRKPWELVEGSRLENSQKVAEGGFWDTKLGTPEPDARFVFGTDDGDHIGGSTIPIHVLLNRVDDKVEASLANFKWKAKETEAKYGTSRKYSPVFGGFGASSFVVNSNMLGGKIVFRVTRSGSLGSSTQAVYQTMCGQDTTGTTNYKYAIPLQVVADERSTPNKFPWTMLAVKYSCVVDKGEPSFVFRSMGVYMKSQFFGGVKGQPLYERFPDV